jgi:uncharacterized protein YndB with AHSA1/START domain
MGAESSELTLEIERVLPARQPEVFAAFADPDLMAQWWGPEGFRIASLNFRPEVGRGYRIEMQPPEGDAFQLIGEFREVEPPVRLAFTFIWEEPDPDDVETLAALEFRDLGDSTEVALTQGAFKTEGRWDLHREGWGDSFDKLERLLSGGERAG